MSDFPPELIGVVDTRPIVRQVACEAAGGGVGRPLLDGGRRIGTRYESDGDILCFFEEIVAADPGASREEQTTAIFETIERVLRAEGMEFGNLVRAWFYLDKILDWYDGFNRARTAFLEARGAFEGGVPASTGIGIPNRLGAAVVAGAMAIKPKASGGVSVMEVPSPMQGPAVAYKSALSRAVEIARAGRRELYISGTASIDPEGVTAHVGDAKAQIDLTMDVVAAILKSRQMDWGNATRAVAYFKYAEDAPLLAGYLRRHGLEKMALTWMHADICRDDLLFELELDAVAVNYTIS